MKSIFTFILIICFAFNLNAKQIHKERSIYRNIVITEKNDLRCMLFESRRRYKSRQACIDLKQPKRIVFEYAHGVLAGYAINPEPKRILIIGLGGGVLSNVMHELSPQAEIINVDIDPVVVKLAREYFNYKENDQVKTVTQDGRVYIKRALLKKEKFDWIILDAFNGDYIPEHLMTKEFLTEAKNLLSENGILSANTFSTSKLYDFESVTYQNVFKQLQIFKAPTKGNRVIFARKDGVFNYFSPPSKDLKDKLDVYLFDIIKTRQRISNKIDWNVNSEMLTDQYSPANLLK